MPQAVWPAASEYIEVQRMKSMNNLFLIGFMGCGKSTIAAGLQYQYGFQVREMDQIIVEREGKAIPQIFEESGEQYFRDLETDILKEICVNDGQVVSCGGGVVLRAQNVSAMKKSGTIILLTASAETILRRVSNDTNRPLLQGKKTVKDISELLEQRWPKYESVADIVISTDNKSVQDICEEIVERLTKENNYA